MVLNSKQVSGEEMDSSPFQELLKKNGPCLEIPATCNTQVRAPQQQKGPPSLKCPRCNSINTKFCYYNNYSRTQPRYFCKACKRHWTEGGTLRDVPVGGTRKAKRLKTSSSSSSSSLSSSTGNSNSRLTANTEQIHPPQLPMDISSVQDINSIFPAVLRCVLTQPSQQLPVTDNHSTNCGATDHQSTLLASSLFPTMFTDVEPVTSTGNRIIVADELTSTEQFPISSCAPLSMQLSASFDMPDQILDTELGQMMQSSSRVDTTAPNFWNCWDDDITGLVATPDH